MDSIEKLNGKRTLVIAVSFVCLMIIFAMTTPFNFSWPENIKLYGSSTTTTEAIAQMEHGNVKRQLGMVLLAVFGVYCLARSKIRYTLNSPAGWILAFYLGWILLSLTWAVDVPFTLRRVAAVMILWFAAIAAAARFSIRELALLAVLVTGTTLALAFANELRLHTMDPFNFRWRFSGLFHTVAMGWNCGLLAMAAMFLATNEEGRGHRFLWWSIVLVAFVFLLLTKSRMAFVATLLGMGYYWYRFFSASGKTLLILGLVIFFCLGYLSLGDRLFYFGVEATTLGRGESAKETVGDLTGRLPLWVESFKWVPARPFRGYGFNSFTGPKNIDAIARNVGWIPNSIHSGYIDAILGIGYVGAAAFVFFLLSAMVRAYNLSWRYPQYLFVLSILLWLAYNLFLEANLITSPLFMTFFCMTLLARLALLPGEEWEK